MKRGFGDTNFLQNLENYGFEDHEHARQEAVQGGINPGESERRGARYRGSDNKGKYGAARKRAGRRREKGRYQRDREAIGIQDAVNSGKETTGAVWEAQEINGRPKDDD